MWFPEPLIGTTVAKSWRSSTTCQRIDPTPNSTEFRLSPRTIKENFNPAVDYRLGLMQAS
jgi:hypothetical protein